MQVPHSSSRLYTRNSQQGYIQSGYQQNLSGSDTDVSTSTENLTPEEKNVLRNGIRQEPQGEETIADDVDISSNTLIIHNCQSGGNNYSPFYGQNFNRGSNILDNLHGQMKDLIINEKSELFRQKYSSLSDNLNMNHINSKTVNESVPSSPKSSVRRAVQQNMHKPPLHGSLQQFPTSMVNEVSSSASPSVQQLLNNNASTFYYPPVSSALHPEMSVQQMTDIPKQYLDQSEILKHLAKEINAQQQQQVSFDMKRYPPLYENSHWPNVDFSKIKETNIYNQVKLDGINVMNAPKAPDRFSVSRSNPDLLQLGKSSMEKNCAKISHLMQRPETHGRIGNSVNPELYSSQASQMIELLSAENTALKSELDLYFKKVSKLQKFELEIQKVHQSHEDLVHSSEKREKLEKAIRMRLEIEIRRLQEQNKELRGHLESVTSHMTKRPHYHLQHADVDDSELRKELSKHEVLIAQLLTQSKELLAEKERQEIELQAQRATLQEQRNHIDILDTALTNAQTNVVKLEEESRKKQVYVERVSQLQKALTSLQQSSERRLQMEKKVRLQLEKEVEALRNKTGQQSPLAQQKKGDDETVESLRKTILEYEKKIIGLEAEVSKWEQRYIEESTMRQIAVDAASVPKDAKIAALERTSQESEKLIAQARSEKLKHMDELYAANRKCAELEERIKDFESKLAEKDAMIKVLQQHSQSKDAVLQHAVLGRPPRHTRAASTVGLTTSTSHTTTTTGASCLGRVSPSPTNMLHRRTESASGSLLSISSESSSTTSPSQPSPVTESVTGSKKSLDEQLKELDSRLSSKDSIISALRAEKERYPSHFWRV